MKHPILIALLSLLPTSPLAAEETSTSAPASPPGLTDKQKSRALLFLKSKDASKRAGAIKAFRKLGDAQKPAYKDTLEKAREHHAKILDKLSFDLAFDDNSLTEFAALRRKWSQKCEEALTMVLTDWNKNSGKHASMDSRFASTETAFGRMLRLTEKAGKKELPLLQPHVKAIAQIDAELAWCEGDAEDADASPDLAAVLRSIDAGDKLIALLGHLDTVSGVEREAVLKHNASQDWATSSQKAFAKLLNDRRFVLGLPLLRLDQQLCAACLGHSKEMGELGYFSHTSPNEENRTFTKRAKNANFKGNATGECIYSGGGGAAGAHKAWWYSDGHRLIMYARNPNTLGIASAGSLWTLNTGKRTW